MADWCRFDHHTWDPAGTRELTGTVDQGVRYADVSPREGDRIAKQESYTVQFASKDGTWSYAPETEAEFHRFQKGSRWELAVEHAGSAKPLKPL